MLVEDLAWCGPSTQAHVLAAALPRERCRVAVAVLGSTQADCREEVLAAGVDVQALRVRHFLDLNGLRRLRHGLGALAPAVVHAWGGFAAAAARLALRRRDESARPRLMVSGAAGGRGIRGWFVARQVRRADRVVATMRVEGELYRQRGVASERLMLIASVAPTPVLTPDLDDVVKGLGVPSGSLVLVGGGKTERGVGPKDAVIAFDMLRVRASQPSPGPVRDRH